MINGKPAVLFDHQTKNDDDGMYSSMIGNWADSQFTVFIVFSARSLPADLRQTLISTNTVEGFGLGIACDGKIGIFNDVDSNVCKINSWVSTNLTVAQGTWYIASFKSDVGVPANKRIQVNSWLNGVSASQTMEMKTISAEAGLMVGTGSAGNSGPFPGNSNGYNGSFDGYIASIIIYQRALSDDERVSVEKYLGNLYGIAVQ
jgi:hypothetical protein